MQVVIHAGGAFADDGRLLNSLQANLNILSAHGVSLVGPRRYRQVFRPVFNAIGSHPVSTDELVRLMEILPDDENTQRTIFTSPDFVGEPVEAIKDGQFYPAAGQRMAILEHAFPNDQVELFFGLINPASFIPKTLAALPQDRRDQILRDTDLSCLSWLSTIEDIRDLAPGVGITLWCNEDTPLIWGDVLRAMAGLDDGMVMQDEYAFLSSLLTEPGKREVLALIRQDPQPDKRDLREALAGIFETHASPEEVEEELELPGWSADIVEAFSELYEQDLARIQSMPDIRFLKP